MSKYENRRVVVVGVGGIGSWLASGLARMLEYRAPGSMLVLVDGDTFEERNKERQNFSSIGNKAAVVANQLMPMFPQTFIVPVAAWVVDVEHEQLDVDPDVEEGAVRKISAEKLLEEGDVVYAVVDNYAARKLLFDAAAKLNTVDVFTGGNDEALYGTVYHYARKDGEDLTEHPVEFHPELANPPDRNPGELSCEERAQLEGGTQLIATNMAVAALLLGRTQKCILEGKEDLQGEIHFDLGEGMALPYNRVPDAKDSETAVTETITEQENINV